MEVIKINKNFKKNWKEYILVERRFYFHFASVDALYFTSLGTRFLLKFQNVSWKKKKAIACAVY